MTSGSSKQPLDDPGVPLGEAVRAFAESSLLREYDELCARIAAWPQPGTERYRRGWPDEDPRSQDYINALRAPICEAREKAWAAVLEDLRRRLETGELIAGGLRAPLKPDAQREDVAPHLWGMLRFGTSSVNGGGLEMVDVRIRRAASLANGPEHSAMDAEASRLHTTRTLPQRSSAPVRRSRGRPSIMRQLEDEMRRRAAAGTLSGGIGEESRALEEWARNNVHDGKIPIADSIEQALRDIYWELRGRKK